VARAMNTRDPIPASALPGSATGEGALAPASRRRRGTLHALIATMRPKQWTKNALVFAAAGAAGALGHAEVALRIAIAFVAFCLLASGIYAINDVRDAPEDRLHPRKRHRPIAAGELEPRTAVALAIGLVVAGLALSAALSPLLAVVGAGYLTLTLSYTMVWRYIALLDVGAIAGGFVLRAVAGGVAAPVTLSRWFVLVISCAALFVAGGKRQSELRRTAADGSSRREVLEHYGESWLRLIVIGSAVCAAFAYCVWASQFPVIDGIPWRPLTVVPFVGCLLRYGMLLRAGEGEAPEELLLRDRWLLSLIAIWLVLFGFAVHDVT
jgi:decaprenyl-phosphate phosphoribosyltransferase